MLSAEALRREVNRLLFELREEHENIEHIFIDLGDDPCKYHFIIHKMENMYQLRRQLQELVGDAAIGMITDKLKECSASRANWDEGNPLEPTPLPAAIHRKSSMRKVILSANITLDGFMAGPKGELDWAIMDEEIDNHILPDLLRTGDTALLGRVLYQGFAKYWPSSQRERRLFSKGATAFAYWIDEVPKVVFSQTLQSVTWQNSRLVQGDIAEEIATLKQQPGKNLILFGGVRTAQTFVKLGLIDEYRLLVHPVILGHGLPLFERNDRINLRLVRVKAYDAGAVLLCYLVEKE